jgi:hypothetical protein
MEEIRMSVEGSISVAVDFNDTYEETAVDVLKKVRLESQDAYTTGKVAIVSGTCSTTATVINALAPGYIGPNGEAVTFSAVSRIGFIANARANVTGTGALNSLKLSSQNNRVAISEIPEGTTGGGGGPTYDLYVARSLGLFESGTASYTVFIYGT